MLVFRIANKKFVRDLSGEGARLYGGRWNRKGSGVLYCSESRSLAIVEYLVHLPMSIIPQDVRIAELYFPDEGSIRTIEADELPSNWTNYPAPGELADIGEEWIQEGKFLALRVPSAVVKNEWNFLLNPNHRSFGKVRIASVEENVFDPRLLRRGPGIKS